MLWIIIYIIKKEFMLDGVVDINVDKNRHSMSTLMSWYSVLSVRELRRLCCDFLIGKASCTPQKGYRRGCPRFCVNSKMII